jgi:hypothetical protein
MDKRSRFLRYGAYGALFAVIAVLSVETGVVRYLRHPIALIGIALSVGYGIFFSGGRKKVVAEPAQLEALPPVNQILRIARQHKGRITVAEVLAETTLELEEVKRLLDELAYAGTCQLTVSERGTQVYFFAEFENAASKNVDALDTSELARKQAQKDHL